MALSGLITLWLCVYAFLCTCCTLWLKAAVCIYCTAGVACNASLLRGRGYFLQDPVGLGLLLVLLDVVAATSVARRVNYDRLYTCLCWGLVALDWPDGLA